MVAAALMCCGTEFAVAVDIGVGVVVCVAAVVNGVAAVNAVVVVVLARVVVAVAAVDDNEENNAEALCRYRLVIFSRSHSLPVFCIACSK